VPEDLFRPQLGEPHHYAYVVEDIEATVNRGLPQCLSAQLGEVDITFHDASTSLGHDIEVHVDSQGLRDFFELVSGGAEGWDGSEPLRPVAS
jgi:hypothetical protein